MSKNYLMHTYAFTMTIFCLCWEFAGVPYWSIFFTSTNWSEDANWILQILTPQKYIVCKLLIIKTIKDQPKWFCFENKFKWELVLSTFWPKQVKSKFVSTPDGNLNYYIPDKENTKTNNRFIHSNWNVKFNNNFKNKNN